MWVMLLKASHTDQMDQCIRYFKRNWVLQKLLNQMIQKYISLGRIGGKVVFVHPTKEEIEVLEGLLGKSLRGKKTVTITMSALQKAIDKSRFQGIELQALFEA